MERRKFVIGLGALGSGAAAAVGTGAFSFNTAFGRQTNIQVANDRNGYVGLVPNSEFAELGSGVAGSSPNNNGALVLDFDLDGGGNGPNNNARTRLADIFKIVNQGTEKIEVSLDDEGGSPNRNGLTTEGQERITWYTVDGGASDPGGAGVISPTDSDSTVLAGPMGSNTVQLDVGDEIFVSVQIDLADNTGALEPGTDLGGDIGVEATSVSGT